MAEMKRVNAGSVPVPDPTALTTAALIREIDSLRERTSHDTLLLRELIETRIDGNDTAVQLLRTTTDKFPYKINEAIKQLQDLHNERFRSLDALIDIRFDSIDTQFAERDKRTEQLSLADKTAIAAALQAQKEAAGAQNESNTTANNKMEASFAKLIDQTQTLLQAVTRNTDDKINDIKSRLDKGEGRTSVSDPVVAEGISKLNAALIDLTKSRDTNQGYGLGQAGLWGFIVGGLGVLFGLGGLIVALMGKFVR